MKMLVALIMSIAAISAYSAEKLKFTVSEWPPYEFSQNGTQKGTDIEITKAVCKEMGRDVEFIFYPWKRCLMVAEQKEVDGILSLTTSKEREAFLTYTSEVLNTSDNILFYSNNNKIKFDSYNDLKGKNIGFSAGYTYGDEFEKHGKDKLFTLDPATNEEQNFKKLDAGRTDAFICDKIVGLYMLNQLGFKSKISPLPKVVSSFDLYLAFTKKPGNDKLAEDFSAALKKIKKNGTYEKIIDKYTK